MAWVTLWLSLARETSSFATAHVFRYHCKWSFLVQSLYWERKCENLSWIVYFKHDFLKLGKNLNSFYLASVWCIFSIAYECHLVFFISTLTFTFQWLEKCFLQAAASGLCTPHSSWSVRAGFAPGLGLPWRSLGLGVCRQQKPWFRPLVKLVPCWRPHRLKLEWEVSCASPLQAGLGRDSFRRLAGGFPCLLWEGDGQRPSSATLPCAGDTSLVKSWKSMKENI